MKRSLCILAAAGLLVAAACPTETQGAIIAAPPSLLPGAVTLDFNGYPDSTAANNLYSAYGLTFSRDDGANFYLMDWTAAERKTISPDGVLATVLVNGFGTWSTHLNVNSSRPLFAAGAYFGNDQASSDFSSIRMSVFDSSGAWAGSVEAKANDNTDVDQFIGLVSDVPFTRIRFDNLSASGSPSTGYSVVLDDLAVVQAPEPSTAWLLVVALCGLGKYLRGRQDAGAPRRA